MNFKRILDKKQYELKDHLGNVRVAIGDMKIPSGNSLVVDEKCVSDFYPGGMSISDRSWQGTSYRYGYNAQEKSLEIDASGNHHTAEFWEVNNARLGRWNTDPVVKAHQSGYSIFGNDPINRNDLNGNDDAAAMSPTVLEERNASITSTKETIQGATNTVATELAKHPRIVDGAMGALQAGEGVFQIIAGYGYSSATGGIGVPLGGAALMSFGLFNIGLGGGILVNSIIGGAPAPNVTSPPGLIAKEITGSDNIGMAVDFGINFFALGRVTSKQLLNYVKTEAITIEIKNASTIISNTSDIANGANLVSSLSQSYFNSEQQSINYLQSVSSQNLVPNIPYSPNTSQSQLPKSNGATQLKGEVIGKGVLKPTFQIVNSNVRKP